MSGFRYVIALLTVIGLPPAIVWWYLIHPFVGFWRRVGPAVTLSTVGVLMVGAMGGLALMRTRLVGTDLGTDWTRAGLGVGLMLTSAWMGARRRRYLTFRILAGVPELQTDGPGGLLTEGPYAVVRHPRYLEVLVGLLGYALFANYTGVYLVALLSVVGLHGVVLLEERELATRFGPEWEAYRARVPRYLPRWFRRPA